MSNFDTGWIKFPTCDIIKMGKKPKHLLFWAWCLMTAKTEKKEFMVGLEGVNVTLEPGQLFFSPTAVNNQTGIPKHIIKSALLYLERKGKITKHVIKKIRSGWDTTIITICNWSKYAGGGK